MKFSSPTSSRTKENDYEGIVFEIEPAKKEVETWAFCGGRC